MSRDPNRAERRRRNRADEKAQRAKEWEEREIEREWEIDPDWNAYVAHVRTELVPKLEGSAMGLSIVPTSAEDVDVKFAVELGMMIMMDKPIILVIRPDQLLPERLRRVADDIVVYDPEHPDHDAIVAAMKRIDPEVGRD